MPLPVTITGIQFPVYITRLGPFVSSGGAVYIVGINTTTTSKLRMMKGSDPTSSFSAVDDADAPDTGNALIASIGVVRGNALGSSKVGDYLHIATWAPSTTTPEVRYHRFDMATDQWIEMNTLIKDVTVVAAEAAFTQRHVSIDIRSAGPVIFYSGNSDTI